MTIDSGLMPNAWISVGFMTVSCAPVSTVACLDLECPDPGFFVSSGAFTASSVCACLSKANVTWITAGGVGSCLIQVFPNVSKMKCGTGTVFHLLLDWSRRAVVLGDVGGDIVISAKNPLTLFFSIATSFNFVSTLESWFPRGRFSCISADKYRGKL